MVRALVLALALAGCTAASPRHPVRPAIVSLNPCADAILAEVAAPGQLLAVSHYSHDPRASSIPVARARRFRATGGTVEEIAALAPDWVVGDSFTPPLTRASLARLGIRFAALPIAADIAGSEAQVRFLAALARRPAAGEALVARIERGLAAAAPPPGWRERSALVWQGGGLVAGDATLVAELLRRTGFRSAAAARGLGQGAVLPLEAMLADPPQVILAAGDPRSDEDRLLRHPALGALAATRRARLDPTLFYCGGPSLPRAAARLAAIRRELSPREGGDLDRGRTGLPELPAFTGTHGGPG